MRILLLSHFFPPTHTAGAENYTYNLARELVERGHEIRVVCAGDWNTGDQHINGISNETYHGIAINRVHLNWTKAPDPNRYLYDNPAVGKVIQRIVQEFQPDVAHITSCLTLSSCIIPVIRSANVPVVLTLVDFWFICPTLHLIRSDGSLCNGQTTEWECLACLLHNEKAYRWPRKVLPEKMVELAMVEASKFRHINRITGLRGMALNMGERKRLMQERISEVNVVIAPSRFLAEVHRSIFADQEIRVQEYGHDMSWLANLTEGSYRAAQPLRFCYIGQITPVKGVHILMTAFGLMKGNENRATLDIYGRLEGDSPYTEELQRIASSDPRISLRGHFPRSELGRVLSEADVIVVPSIWYENNPLVIQEAFAAGKPVIVSGMGGMSEFVEDEGDGLHFRVGDSSHLTSQMERLATDPSLVAELRARIPPVKTIDQEVDELLTIYESQILEQAQSSVRTDRSDVRTRNKSQYREEQVG